MNDQPVTSGTADVVERLARLRAVVALMARDLAAARRRATELEIDNQRLTRRVRDLESRLPAGAITQLGPRHGDGVVRDAPGAPPNGRRPQL